MAAHVGSHFTITPSLSSLLLVVTVFASTGYCNNLTCYWCNSTEEDSLCYTNVTEVDVKQCQGNEDHCSVSRVDIVGKMSYISRDCNASCKAKCGTWGDDQDEDRCSSCCNTSLCNIDSAATSLFAKSVWAGPLGSTSFWSKTLWSSPMWSSSPWPSSRWSSSLWSSSTWWRSNRDTAGYLTPTVLFNCLWTFSLWTVFYVRIT